MNVTGHIAVAQGLSDDPRVWLGAALPDLATFGGYRLMRPATHPAIAEGVRLHHRTDDAFHGSEWFKSRQRRLRTDLASRDVPRGPARAAAHVGPEMLIDGALLSSAEVREAVGQAMAQLTMDDNELNGLVDDPHWLDHLAAVQRRGLPDDYADPVAVARRLERILRRRPRLRLDPTLVETVGDALKLEADGIATTTQTLVDDLVAEIAAT